MADKTVKLTGSRSFQDIGTIGSTTEQLSGNIQSINANLDVGLRNTKNIIDSFLRVSDLVALGLVSLDGNMLSAAPAAVTAVINVADSIVGDGSVATPLKLDGDTASPGNSMYYGTDSGGTKGWGALPSGATGANPSANVGLSAVNGSATTYMRSDAAPPLNQAIVPTWTGAHTFSSSVALNGAVSTTGGIVVNAATGGGQGAGTINATGLFINGVAVGTGSGSVSSVGVTSTDLSVSGSPVTTSGNITLNINAAAVTLAKMANLAANSIIGNNTGSPATPLALTTTQVKTLLAIAYTDVSGLATVAHTGAYSDLTGTPTLLTSPLTTKGDVWGYSTTDARVPVGSNTFVLTADSTAALGVKWAAPSAGTPANPTASVGLTAVNGSATTYMRSDAAPALDQGISPTWTGLHTFTDGAIIKSDTVPLQVQNAAGTLVSFITTVKGWVGSGSVTDFAIGAKGKMSLYAANSVNSSIDIDGTTRGVAINTPASGAALTVGSGTFTGFQNAKVQNTSTTSNDSAGYEIDAGSTQAFLIAANQNQASAFMTNGPTGPQVDLITVGAYPILFGTNNTYRGGISAGGAWTIANPTGGVGLTVNATTATTAISASDGTHVINFAPGLTGTINVDNALALEVAGNPALSLSSARNVTIAAPVSGNALAVNAVSGGRGITVAGAGAGIAVSINTGTTLGLYIDNTAQGVGTAAIRVDVSAQSAAKTIAPVLTTFPGTNAGAKNPTYLPISLNGSKFWISCIPD